MLRTASERINLLDLGSMTGELFGLSPLVIQNRHDEAFNVESVTKAFYKELANWYFWARECVTFPKDAKPDADGKPSVHLIRLITRLIFCWFLREKQNPLTRAGLLPNELFDPRHIRKLLKDPSGESCTYYTAILQNLFFATLNTEVDKSGDLPIRRFIDEGDGRRSDDHMIHTFWRHKGQLRDPEVFVGLLKDVPFLNGGLFECLDDRVPKGNSPYTEEIRIDGFSNDPKKQPKIPNYLFFGNERVVDLSPAYGDASRRQETVRPLLSILHNYNFTLAENTPLEQEVALDPELLGHVFENLLAAYNPETGMVARKATGSFYTPRVVVDWMVDQALVAFLKEKLRSDEVEKKLWGLVSWDTEGHNFSPEETETLIDAIDSLKAIDPACGSGAFPMGLLQKLVHVLKKLDPANKGWRIRQEVALDSFASPVAREEAKKAIERAFAHDNDDYGRKLYLIENCLYGVDIQPIACQIAKLRFFISLIVDQTIDPKEPNFGILPLPNLETKIVAANTLLGLQRGQLLLGSEKVHVLEGELQRVRHDYFTSRRYRDKKALRARDRELCTELAATLTECSECSPYDSKRLAEWNPYDTNTAASFFDPGWMFGLPVPSGHTDGMFDIVIGNPPYVRQEELKSVMVTGSDGKEQPLKEVLKNQYETYTGTADLYVYFFERSLQLLSTGGVLSFITSNKYFRSRYGELLRAYLSYATNPQAILDFGDAPLFTSIAYPAIIVTQKTRHITKGKLASLTGQKRVSHQRNVPKEGNTFHGLTWSPGPALDSFPEIFEQQAITLAQSELKPDSWRLESPVKLRLLERLRKIGTPLNNYVQGRMYRGLVTGLNKAFIIDISTRNRLIAEDESSREVIKSFIRGRDAKRWRIDYSELWLLFIPWHFPMQEDSSIKGASNRAEREFAKRYPAVFEHLHQYKPELSARNATETGVRYEWYALQRWGAEYWKEFEENKIVWGNLATQPQFSMSKGPNYISAPATFLVSDSRYLLGVLNSQTTKYLVSQSAAARQGGFLEYKPMYVSPIPIPPVKPDKQSCFERLVDALIYLNSSEVKKPAHDSSGLIIAFFEQWLNGLVYELFFPGEFEARKLHLFQETARLNLPDLKMLADNQKPIALQEVFERAYNTDAVVRSMLFDLQSIEVVRIIEEESNTATPLTGGQE